MSLLATAPSLHPYGDVRDLQLVETVCDLSPLSDAIVAYWDKTKDGVIQYGYLRKEEGTPPCYYMRKFSLRGQAASPDYEEWTQEALKANAIFMRLATRNELEHLKTFLPQNMGKQELQPGLLDPLQRLRLTYDAERSGKAYFGPSDYTQWAKIYSFQGERGGTLESLFKKSQEKLDNLDRATLT